MASDPVRWVLTAIGCVGGAELVRRLAAMVGKEFRPSPLLIFSALQIPVMIASPILYDRYILFLLPGALDIAMAGTRENRLRWISGLALLVVFGAVSVSVLHDWYAFNVARWNLGWRAVRHHAVDPKDIEGGLEWDGWFSPKPSAWNPPRHGEVEHRQVFIRGLSLEHTQLCFPHMTGMFALACGVPEGALLRDAEPYSLWLVPGPRFMYLIQWQPGIKRASPAN
jgi:hypothetical protein